MLYPDFDAIQVKIVTTANFTMSKQHIWLHIFLTDRTRTFFSKFHWLHLIVIFDHESAVSKCFTLFPRLPLEHVLFQGWYSPPGLRIFACNDICQLAV